MIKGCNRWLVRERVIGITGGLDNNRITYEKQRNNSKTIRESGGKH